MEKKIVKRCCHKCNEGKLTQHEAKQEYLINHNVYFKPICIFCGNLIDELYKTKETHWETNQEILLYQLVT